MSALLRQGESGGVLCALLPAPRLVRSGSRETAGSGVTAPGGEVLAVEFACLPDALLPITAKDHEELRTFFGVTGPGRAGQG